MCYITDPDRRKGSTAPCFFQQAWFSKSAFWKFSYSTVLRDLGANNRGAPWLGIELANFQIPKIADLQPSCRSWLQQYSNAMITAIYEMSSHQYTNNVCLKILTWKYCRMHHMNGKGPVGSQQQACFQRCSLYKSINDPCVSSVVFKEYSLHIGLI